MGRFKNIVGHSMDVDSSNKIIRVLVNGSPIDVRKGMQLGAVLSEANAFYEPGSTIAIGHRTKSLEPTSTKYQLITNRGSIVLEISRRNRQANAVLAKLAYALPSIQLSDANSLSIGPFDLQSKGTYKEFELDEGEIFLDASGMDAHRACLVLCKKRHRAYYSLVTSKPVGRIVAGKKTLLELTAKDKILGLSPFHIPDAALELSFQGTSDLQTMIDEEGTIVHSCVEVRLLDTSPDCADLFLHSIRGKSLMARMATGSFLSTDGLSGIQIIERNPTERGRGSISIRNEGKGQGQFYFFKRNRTKSASHTVIGEITKGMELVDFARERDLISIRANCQPIGTAGMTQIEAGNYLASLGITQLRDGSTSDQSVVVGQNPSTTLEILKRGSVETTGLDKDLIVRIRLDEDRAPNSIRYFRAATGLMFAPIGSLQIEYAYSQIVGAVLAKGNSSRVTCPTLHPENTPTSAVAQGEIGITNSVKERMGTIGVRIDRSREFGPTCEALEGTNIIGTLEKESIPIARMASQGSVIYVVETGEHPASAGTMSAKSRASDKAQ